MRSTTAPRLHPLLRFFSVLLLLLAAGYFRFTGLTWGDYQYPHPDERFLIWVVADIAPVASVGEYFDSANSSLNPVNRGHGFYVYGDFPVIITRYTAEALFEQVGWQEILQTGRGLSALLDLLTVLLVYFIAARLIDERWALLAGLLSGAAVLQIQQAHFFTSDSFAVFFTTLTIYLGVRIAGMPVGTGVPVETEAASPAARRYSPRMLRYSILYGAAVGLAMACKINTAPVALLLPAALVLWHLRAHPGAERFAWRSLLPLAVYAAAGGAAALLVFRVAMPYAFSGPGFFGILPEERWLKSMRDLSAQSSGDVDFPPALQWARRNNLFSIKNMVLWGLGPALGIASWVGFLACGWRIFSHLRVAGKSRVENGTFDAGYGLTARRAGTMLVWLWTGAYFLWQSLAWNPTMRYQLPIYPTLAIFAAWGLAYLWRSARAAGPGRRLISARVQKAAAAVGVVLVFGLTVAWAFAFTRIYTRTETRLAASQWIYENVPGPVNLSGTSQGRPWKLMLPLYASAQIRPDLPYLTQFEYAGDTANNGDAERESILRTLTLPALHVQNQGGMDVVLAARVYSLGRPEALTAESWMLLPESGRSLDAQVLTLTSYQPLQPGTRYTLALSLEARRLNGAGGADSGADGEDGAEIDLNAAAGLVQVQMDGQISAGIMQQSPSVRYQPDAAGAMEVVLGEGGSLRQMRRDPDSLPPGEQLRAASVLTILQTDMHTSQQAIASAFPGLTEGSPLNVDPPLTFQPGKRYQLAIIDSSTGMPVDDQPYLLDFLDQPAAQWFPPLTQPARPDDPLRLAFSSGVETTVTQVTLGRALPLERAGPNRLRIAISSQHSPEQPLAQAEAVVDGVSAAESALGEPVFTLDRPLNMAANESYLLTITPESGAVQVSGAAPANESTWDMALPFRAGLYDPYGGYYRGDLTFEMYWDDNQDKYDRFVNILDQADYLFFSSNRQWGTTTRIPERYPLTTRLYSDLLGCPAEMNVIDCYNVAEPGMFAGRLGFELVKTVTSYPNLGGFEINDQFAEEAFTVYDHPKVMIFQKQPGYDPAVTRARLGEVDLDAVVHLTPRKAADWHDLLLPARLWSAQQAGGTFAALFPPDGLLNAYPWLGALAYYLLLLALGLAAYPLLRAALPGLADRGYPLARTAGMVIFAYLAWLPGSLGIAVTRWLLAAVFALLALAGLLVARRGGSSKRGDSIRGNLRYYLAVEVLALVLFGLGLLLRLGNPDLWHPIFGGEKPMDFSYFNAVLKSSVFPPYDPWFAGGYINYYYYGFVLVGMPVKLLGITPSVAYNLIMPGLFMLTGLGAFSLVYNLAAERPEPEPVDDPEAPAAIPTTRRSALRKAPFAKMPFAAGLAAVALLLIFGNLGIPRMYWQGLQKLVVPEQQMVEAGLFERIGWAADGLGRMLRGEADTLPFYPSDWYWKPSRAIQPESGGEITEFPFFTFLYGDMHAHLIALPVTILAAGWALGIWLGRKRAAPAGNTAPPGAAAGGFGLSEFGLWLAVVLGALFTGVLRPANTWDQYTFLVLAALALFAARFFDAPGQGLAAKNPRRWLRALLPVGVMVGLALLFYYPFNLWFKQGYNSLEPWRGAKTNLASYLSHWGLFLFVIGGWLLEETLDWMAATPLSALARLRPHKHVLLGTAGALLLGILGLALSGVVIALVAAPLGVWVTLLLARRGQSNAKRAVLFAVGTALALTLAVELVAVRGDIGRMNSSFKFYYQAWTLLALSSAAALGWLWPRLAGWRPGASGAWLLGLGVLAFSAALFPLHAMQARFSDRMAPGTPRTLDGMRYLQDATYIDGLTAETLAEMDLSQDYDAIRWMQANVSGSPVIVEANTPEYRHWGSRFTIYTGLPGVVGWNWHQRQQRLLTPDTWIWGRISEIENFYRTTSPEQAAAFLEKYGVKYIILGQLERIWYGGPGLDKFARLDGVLWDAVYQREDTHIYEVR